MNYSEILKPLVENPIDARSRDEALLADEVVYRLCLTAIRVPGLPAEVQVDDVRIQFVDGPVLGQRTVLRQRHQLPVVFDKCMVRTEFGVGQFLALVCIRAKPPPRNLEEAFSIWRRRALAAAGMIAATLDERIAGEELFEDAVLLRHGEPLGGADMRTGVRTVIPLEVNLADHYALGQLSEVSIDDTSAAARAARLYRRAAIEGPTADAYAMLWVAAECFSEQRSPSRKEIEAALDEAGIDVNGLPVGIRRLIDLRGKIQHHGLDDHDDLKTAFYEMEAVVRVLIRRDAGIAGGWWPAPNNPASLSDPFDEAFAHYQGRGSSVWHSGALPSLEEPPAFGLPRRVPIPENDPRVVIDDAFEESCGLIGGIVVDALEWLDPEQSDVKVVLGLHERAPTSALSLANAEGIWLAPERLEGLADPDRPEVLVNLVWDLHGLVGAVVAQRAGMKSDGLGAAWVESIGSWAQYRRLVTYGGFEAELLQIPTGDSPMTIGKLSGWAAAGDEHAAMAIASLAGESRETADQIVAMLASAPPRVPSHILDEAIRELAS